MANLKPYQLAISVCLSKHSLAVFFTLSLLFAGSTFAQDHLSAKERQAFNEAYFEAQALKTKGDYEKAGELFKELYKSSPSNAAVNFELAQYYTETDNRESAIFHAERAVELEPANQWYAYLLANIYGQFNRPGKQVEVYQNLLEHDESSNEYRLELAQAYLANNQPQKALEQFNKMEEQMGVNEFISEQKKTIYLDLGDLDAATREIRKLIEAYPNTMEYYGTLGQLYSVNGFEEEAFEVYQEMLEVDSTDPRPHLDLANYYRGQNNFKKSLHHLKYAMESDLLEMEKKIPVLLSLFNASANDSVLREESYAIMNTILKEEDEVEDPRIFAMYGDFLSRDGRDLEAITYYKKALGKEGGQKFQIWEQVLLIEVQNEMYDSLAIDAPQAVEAFPNQPLPYFFAGLGFAQQEEYDEAVYYLEDGLNYVLGQPALKEQFYLQLADVHHRLKNHQQSDGYFEKALAINIQNATTLNNYAYYLAVRGENLDRALEMSEKSNRLSPDNPTFLDTWAWVHFKRQEYQKAEEKMEKVFSLQDKQSGEVREHYGDILNKLGKTEQALEQYEKALEGGYRSQSLLSKIKALQ